MFRQVLFLCRLFTGGNEANMDKQVCLWMKCSQCRLPFCICVGIVWHFVELTVSGVHMNISCYAVACGQALRWNNLVYCFGITLFSFRTVKSTVMDKQPYPNALRRYRTQNTLVIPLRELQCRLAHKTKTNKNKNKKA